MGPEILQHPLSRADGSTVYADRLYAIIAGVNGPVEVQRRDELPEEAAVEVNLRPSSGVGGPRERWLETVLQAVLKNVLLVHMHPRTLFQITLQLTKQPSETLRRTAHDISIIPTLLNAAFLALVDSGLPLATTISAALAIVNEKGEVQIGPQSKDMSKFKSIHAMAYNSEGGQILDESSGQFDLETWENVTETLQQVCLAAMARKSDDETMTGGLDQDEGWLRQALEQQAIASAPGRNKT